MAAAVGGGWRWWQMVREWWRADCPSMRRRRRATARPRDRTVAPARAGPWESLLGPPCTPLLALLLANVLVQMLARECVRNIAQRSPSLNDRSASGLSCESQGPIASTHRRSAWCAGAHLCSCLCIQELRVAEDLLGIVWASARSSVALPYPACLAHTGIRRLSLRACTRHMCPYRRI